MPRTREFDPEQALEAAMQLFWKKGYAGTSIEDLVEVTGVNRYGLYDVFESKHGIFLASLERYHRNVISQAIRELEQPGAGLQAIHAVFERIVARVRAGRGRFGCLLCNTAEEVAPFDAQAARVVTAFQQRLEKGFARAVTVARKNGEVPAGPEAARLGRYLAGLIQGASFLARSPAGPRSVEDLVRIGLRVLG